MKQFDILIKNGTILTMDSTESILDNGAVGIKGDKISFIGRLDDSQLQFTANKIIDAEKSLVLPGLINGHTHAAMTLFRGLADDLPLMDWLNNYIFPVESRMNPEFVFRGTALACVEMIMSGTTTFCDMYLFEEETARAAKETGVRALVGEVLYDFDSPNYGPVEKGLEYTENLINKWEHDPLVSIAVEPHATFTCSPDLLSSTKELANKYNVPLVIHLSETLSEFNGIKEKYGKTPVEYLNSLGLLSPHLIADHCVHLEGNDIELLAENGVKVIHVPESNMKLASGIAPIGELLNSKVVVGLGTDGCASNNDLDLFTEMDISAKLQKVETMDTTAMDALTVLKMTTIEGAKSLGMDRSIGSIEEGKKADIIILDTNKPHLTPMYNPYSHLVYSAKGNDVRDTIINGKLLMENRKLLTIDLDEVLHNAREEAKNVTKWLSEVEQENSL